MKDGAVIANSGHFNVEIDLTGLAKLATKVLKGVRNLVDGYELPGGATVYVLAEGRLVNLAAAEGHPAAVMDMSFAVQALATEWVANRRGKLDVRVHEVPHEVDEFVAALKLKSMGIQIDTLTSEQRKYLSSSDMGT
jgi:adenosylhomocysteinase